MGTGVGGRGCANRCPARSPDGGRRKQSQPHASVTALQKPRAGATRTHTGGARTQGGPAFSRREPWAQSMAETQSQAQCQPSGGPQRTGPIWAEGEADGPQTLLIPRLRVVPIPATPRSVLGGTERRPRPLPLGKGNRLNGVIPCAPDLLGTAGGGACFRQKPRGEARGT